MNVDNINVNDLKTAYKVIKTIMDNNKFNYITAWRHVKAELAMAIADNA